MTTDLKFIGSQFCNQYQTRAVFFIETVKNNMRHLVVYYENDRSAFRTGIPDDWSEEQLTRFLQTPTDDQYPVWEQPARRSGSPVLMERKLA
jgi:hypothetical protein